MVLSAIKTFDKGTLKPCRGQKVTQIADLLQQKHPEESAAPVKKWTKRNGKWVENYVTDVNDGNTNTGNEGVSLDAPSYEVHGQCYGFEAERDTWEMPLQTHAVEHAARPGYDTMDASEYADVPEVLKAKVAHLARLILASQRLVVYAGAGLSTAAGIDDYASAVGGRGVAEARLRSPLCAQPTFSHRVLVALQKSGLLHRLIQQNHDGLPQKAGMPQHCVNEIHGALHAPDNPVVPMTGNLREDNMRDLLELEQSTDLVLAIGTSLAGMNADRVFHSCARRSNGKQHLGCVLIGLQRSLYDSDCTLRIFEKCDKVCEMLVEEIADLAPLVPMARPQGEYFRPRFLEKSKVVNNGDESNYVLEGLRYDAVGRKRVLRDSVGSDVPTTCLDLRDGAEVVIPTGMHAGACGVVDGVDREGNPRIRFQMKLNPNKVGGFKTAIMRPLGLWWLQAAFDASVDQLPVVQMNLDDPEIKAMIDAYA